MNAACGPTRSFPKSARLLVSREFYLSPCERFQTSHFRFFHSNAGSGRLGVSLSKKVLKHAVARNRVRRLLREVFRHERAGLSSIDLHIVGRSELGRDWEQMTRANIGEEFQKWQQSLTKR